MFLFQQLEKDWKSRQVSRTIRPYIKPKTLQEEEGPTNTSSLNISEPIFKGALRTESMNNSIQGRLILSPSVYQQKYAHEQLFESQMDQRSFDTGVGHSEYYAPKHEFSLITDFNPNEQDILNTEFSADSRITLALKAHRQKERQLDQILEIMDMETETPGYVRQIRTTCGEDIKGNNFAKMERVPCLPLLHAREYLEQIEG